MIEQSIDVSTTATLPELGPWLGRLCNAGAATRFRHFVPLDDIRLALATGVLDLAGAARGFSPDDHAAIVGSLHARNWRRLWEEALGDASTRTADAIDSGFASAAALSRFPKRRLARIQVNDTERAAMKARLGAGAIPFEESLVRLDDLAGAAGSSARGSEAAFNRWTDGLAAAARALESAWMALEEAADAEGARWKVEIDKVRDWTRPRWPLWLFSGLVIAASTWLGLVLGGFLEVPGWLRPFAEFWWTRLPFA